MKLKFDLHTHTISSGHAYSTLAENIAWAKENGLEAYGMSDHAMNMPGASGELHFQNFKVVPRRVYGVQIYCGVEANIVDYDGNTDCTKIMFEKVDYVIASMHPPCVKPGTLEQNTNALIGAMHNPKIKVIGHPDDSRFPLDYDLVVKTAIETNTILEVNNSSLDPRSTRQGARENLKIMLHKCKEYGAKIIVSTDSHMCFDVGRFDEAVALLKEYDFPEELVINTSLDGLKYVLNIEPLK